MRNSEKFKGFDAIKDTIFLKKFNKENYNLKKLENMSTKVKDYNIKKQIDREISLMKWGLEGESSVYFELKNSLLPMICLHDIRIEIGDLNAQIDFLVLTNKFIYIFETKHLVGNITINEDGSFIRIINENGYKKEEGMYNPITQGERHSRILKKFFEVNNILKNVEDFPIKSVAILANPKTVLSKENAPSHIKDNIYRCDQIVHFLQKEFSNEEYEIMISDSKLESIGLQILKNNCPIEYNYELKFGLNKSNYSGIEDNKSYSKKSTIVELQSYRDNPLSNYSKDDCKSLNKFETDDFIMLDTENHDISIEAKFSKYEPTTPIETRCLVDFKEYREKIESELRHIRKVKSKQLKIEAYKLFTNKQLEKILNCLPDTIEDLKMLNIIPKDGYLNIGEDIVDTIKKYTENIDSKYNISVDKDYECVLSNNLEIYRTSKAKELGISEYKVFTNNQIRDITKYKPLTVSDLYKISGFDKSHVKNYGEDILNLINNKKSNLG